MAASTAGVTEPPLREPDALALSAVHFATPQGPDLLGRSADLAAWTAARRRAGVLPYFGTLEQAPTTTTRLTEDTGRTIAGVNFTAQDYLGLAAHPAVREAAVRAIRDFGTHSAGSGLLQGGTRLGRELEAELAGLVRTEHVILFPTGWGAGFAAIAALIRPYDHVVLDGLAHASLQQGAMAATQRVHRHRHLDVDAARRMLRRIRRDDARCGILVVTEGLFSMDADTPRLRELQSACREFGATLLVDVAHDLGQLGPAGSGQLGAQGVLGEVDLVMGAFSKTFASNGGFLAMHDSAVKDHVRVFGGPFAFSNAPSPPQIAAALEAVRISRTAEGDDLRSSLDATVAELRDGLAGEGIGCLGLPCAIVAVPIGRDSVGRVAQRLLRARGVLANLVEFPAVAQNRSRFRMQVMATHTGEQARDAARVVAACITEATELIDRKGGDT